MTQHQEGSVDSLISALSEVHSESPWPVFVPNKADIDVSNPPGGLSSGRWIRLPAVDVIKFLRSHAKVITSESNSAGTQTPEVGTSGDQDGSRSSKALSSLLSGQSSKPGPSRLLPVSNDSADLISSMSANPPQVAYKSPSGPDDTEESTDLPKSKRLEELLEKLATGSQSRGSANEGLNEEGLPIHEIRETSSGEVIGDMPEPVIEDVDMDVQDTETKDDEDDYWSAQAVARREALKKRIFGGDDSDLDSDVEDTPKVSSTSTPSVSLQSASPISPRLHSPPPKSPVKSRSPSPSPPPPQSSSSKHPRRPSASIPPPSKSILKPPPIRKKSVSFDDSVPLPPDSPENSNTTGKMGFPLPGVEVGGEGGEFQVKPVPVISEPIPPIRKGQNQNIIAQSGSFGGMKRGFLDTRKPVAGGSHGQAGITEGASNLSISPEDNNLPPKKKPSLFAQRMAQSESLTQQPALAKMSDLKSTASVKPTIIEKPMSAPSPVAGPSSTANKTYPTVDEGDAEDYLTFDDEDEEEDDDEDEEDEYDLDDALLAREVALDYHKRQAYSNMASGKGKKVYDLSGNISGDMGYDDDDDEEGYENVGHSDRMMRLDGENVMLGIPEIEQVTGQPIIKNPTSDDWRKFVRVGKMEDGQIVLAPGEEWSEEENEGDEDGQAKRANRDRVKRQLLGLDVADSTSQRITGKIGSDPKAGDVGMPPVVGTAPAETPYTKAVGEVKEKGSSPSNDVPISDPPKKVSRFKAARMGA